jgi:hypothetical protein
MKTVKKGSIKIFTGPAFIDNQTKVNIIVAASSRKKVVAALAEHGIRETEGNIGKFWFVIGSTAGTLNEEHYAQALAEPGKPLANSGTGASDFKPVPVHTPA